jgi:hypothetical protein
MPLYCFDIVGEAAVVEIKTSESKLGKSILIFVPLTMSRPELIAPPEIVGP